MRVRSTLCFWWRVFASFLKSFLFWKQNKTARCCAETKHFGGDANGFGSVNCKNGNLFS